ncbi:capsule assembly protein Wzi [Tamilnaduibacter salinus]|uniref:Capsule assembly protein Wzi n=1 Tax=Tamilnaduibacter salinus TaxID=1484056 RepID=A0A2U1CV15_9GAMM|nr:capsule assembly Wzi family protein [Tamilnaduibacter salinus]PVY70811.1 capsule assembly protein Wzi [Tamilnaduibacter salinus]
MGWRGDLSLGGQIGNGVSRGRAERLPEQDGLAQLRIEYLGEWLALGLAPGYAPSPDDNTEWRYDGTYVAVNQRGWTLAAGATDRWWGPGQQSSFLFESQSRPIPAVSLRRHADSRSPLASMTGPWSVTIMGARLADRQDGPSDDFSLSETLYGARWTIKPTAGLTLGAGAHKQDAAGRNRDDIDTMALDARYAHAIGTNMIGIYGQLARQTVDQTDSNGWLAGLDWVTTAWHGEQRWFTEYETHDDDARANAPSHHGDPINQFGAQQDRTTSLGVHHYAGTGWNTGLVLQHRNNPTTDNLNVARITYGHQLLAGWLTLNAQIADDDLDTQSGENWTAGAEWTYRF